MGKRYSERHDLHRKAGSKPIPTGARIAGFMNFVFDRVTYQAANGIGAFYEMRCRDAAGREALPATYTIEEKGSMPQNMEFTGLME